MIVDIKRIARHLLMTHWQVRRAFSGQTLREIEAAIKASEAVHGGQVRFAVEGALHTSALFKGQASTERAVDVFSQLRMWDTEDHSGVLIYLLLADRAVEIVADRGIHRKVPAQEWRRICAGMETGFRNGNYAGGLIDGIEAVTQHLALHFPASNVARNELPDQPVMMLARHQTGQ